MKQLLLTFLIMLTGWVSTAQQVEQVRFFDNLKAYCGETFPGKVVHGNPFPGVTEMSITFEVCDETEIKIPFVVGENKSRTWILTMTADGLQLKHDHRHEDGTLIVSPIMEGLQLSKMRSNKSSQLIVLLRNYYQDLLVRFGLCL